MKTIEITKSGKNFTAVHVGQLSDIKNYELHMGSRHNDSRKGIYRAGIGRHRQ